MNTNNIISLTTQDSIPQASSGTGTITSVNNKKFLKGVGTLFTTEAKIGDYIYIKGQNEFSRIETIVSDTELYVDRAFTVDLSGSAYHITPYSKYDEVSVTVTGAGAATIDGVSFTQGQGVTFRKDGSGTYGQNKYVAPIDINATGTTVRVSLQY